MAQRVLKSNRVGLTCTRFRVHIPPLSIIYEQDGFLNMLINILGHAYQVLFVDEVDNKSHPANSLMGVCKTADLEIQVLNTLPVSRQEETLLHELLHALGAALDTNLKEKQVHQLSEGLYQVLKPYGLQLLPADKSKSKK